MAKHDMKAGGNSGVLIHIRAKQVGDFTPEQEKFITELHPNIESIIAS